MLRVKYERLSRGWNQTALAYHVCMSVGDISRIESGRLRPYPSQLEKLSRVFGVDGAALLEDTAGNAIHIERGKRAKAGERGRICQEQLTWELRR